MDIWYYGGRWRQGCHPDDLWTSYFTSSVYVAIQRWLYGEPDVIEVRQTFKTKEEAQDWEIKVLKRMKVVKSERWLNKTDRKGPSNFGIPHSEEHKQKLSEAHKGKKCPKSDETKNKLSLALKGKPRHLSEESKKKMSRKGKTHSDESKQKISLAMKRKNSIRRT